MNDVTLTCTQCLEEKPDDAFTLRSHAVDTGPRRGRKSWCKKCTNTTKRGQSNSVMYPKPRPAHMQGPAVPIFAPWASGVERRIDPTPKRERWRDFYGIDDE